MMDGKRHRETRPKRETNATMLALLAVTLACAALVPGCSTTDYRDVRISTEYDDNTDFAAIKTWAWLPKAPASIQDPRVHDETAYARLRRVIAAELASKGLTEAIRGNPHVWVHHTVWLMARGDLPRVDSPGSTRAADSTSAVEADDEGGLLIELLDGISQKRIWVAQVRAFLKLEVTPEEKEARVRNVVRKMFDEYPPRAWREATKAR